MNVQIEGRLIGPWVGELEQCWRMVAAGRSGRAVVADLTDLTFVDEAGKTLLAEIRSEHVSFVASNPMTKALVEEITSACARKSHASLAGPASRV